MTESRVKSGAFRLISMSLPLLVLLGVAEVLARIDGGYRAHLAAIERRRLASEPRRWVDVDEARPPRDRNETLILAVGDSFTHGVTVGLERSWPKQLEWRLNRESIDGRTYTVLNAGVGAADLQQEIDTIDRAVHTLEPDLVVHQLYLNDFFGKLGFHYEECDSFQRTTDAFRAPHFELHALYYLWWWKTQAIHGRRYIRFVNCYGQEDRPHWQVAARSLRGVQSRLHEAGVAYLVFLAPAMYWRHGEYPLQEMHDSIGNTVGASVRHYVDLLPPLMAKIDLAEDHWLDPDLPDAHPDSVVQGYFAERIAEVLHQRGLLAEESLQHREAERTSVPSRE